jgi:hypothetical protein
MLTITMKIQHNCHNQKKLQSKLLQHVTQQYKQNNGILPESFADNSTRLQTLVTVYCPGSLCSSSSLFVGITNSTSAIFGYV